MFSALLSRVRKIASLTAPRFLMLVVCGASYATGTNAEEKVTDNLVLDYGFGVPAATVSEKIGQFNGADLAVPLDGVSWLSCGGIEIKEPAFLPTQSDDLALSNALKTSGELTIDTWIKPSSFQQNGPARIITLSLDPYERNFTLGQEKDAFVVRLRTSESDLNGLEASTITPAMAASNLPIHVAYTYDLSGLAKIYVNGNLLVEQALGGNLSNWDVTNVEFGLGNEVTLDRPWLGSIYSVSVYNRALPQNEIVQNFNAGFDTTCPIAPVVVASVSEPAGLLPFIASFSAAGSHDIDGTIENYLWDFGDGHTAEGANVSHTYSTEGDYQVKLSVTDNSGLTASKELKVSAVIPGVIDRSSDSNLRAYYLFDEKGGDFVYDLSGNTVPLDLKIADIDRVERLECGGLRVLDDTIIKSLEPALDFTQKIKSANRLTIEAWVEAENSVQGALSPARIATLSADQSNRNFTFGQAVDEWKLRLRTTDNGLNGSIIETDTTGISVSSELQHVVYTHDDNGESRIYVDGKLAEDENVSGSFANWSESYYFALANELVQERSFIGDYHLIAVYDRVLSSGEILERYIAGSPHAACNSGFNNPPIITSLPVTTAYEGDENAYHYLVEAEDEDIAFGDVLSYSLDKFPATASIDESTGLINWMPGAEYVASVPEFNEQCYIVPAGSVGVLQEEIVGSEPTYIAPLFQDVKTALELAGDYTAPEVYQWNERNNCLGCHVQTQSLVGLETSMDKAEIDESMTEYLLQEFLNSQQSDGSIRKSHPQYSKTQTSLALWALEHHPDRARTASTRAEALRFFQATQQGSAANLYWTRDHDTAWLRIPQAINALVAQGLSGFLSDVNGGEIEFNAAQLEMAELYLSEVDAIVSNIIAGNENNNLDFAFKLIGLAELADFVQDESLKAQVFAKIQQSDARLREEQNEDGGWHLAFSAATSDPLVTAWVGLALDYGNPVITDPVVINAIKYLLSTQQANGVWRTSTGWFTTNYGTTSLVMAYLPVALDHLGNPDLRVGDFGLTASEDGSLQLSVEISNRGITDVNTTTTLEIFSGLDSTGELLGRVTVPEIPSAISSTVSIPLASDQVLSHSVYAQIVDANHLEECEILNNSNVAAVFKARVTDRAGLFDTQIFAVNVADVNEAPEFQGDSALELEGAQVLRSIVEADDVDRGDALAFSLLGAPEGLYIDERTGQFTSDPAILQPGDYVFTITVTDLRGASAEREITLSVNENLPPLITTAPVQQGIEGLGYAYDVDATDPNNDELGYALDRVYEPSVLIGNSTGVISDDKKLFVESLRNNNIFCEKPAAELSPFNPVEKWHWDASGAVVPNSNQVMHAPIAVPLFDTDGSGVIDSNDEIAIVFATFTGGSYNTSGILRAVSADTGETIWSNTDVPVRAASAIAAADIDGDGFVEIIVGPSGRLTGGVYAFEHDGTFKWKSDSQIAMQWGGVSIADLEGDGVVDIVAGNHVINPDGTTKWSVSGNSGANGVGPLSIVADLDLDGIQEVIAGATAYTSAGEVLFAMGEGFPAVGNFDSDDYPEIVRVYSGYVYLHDNDGTQLWSSIIPGGGKGGAPTIADMNGDGKLNIGVAGASFYAVYNADGSILWQVPTFDSSSNVTGSSVFDFDGNGAVEVVYGDQTNLRIYNGSNGNVIYEIPNPSGTTYEYPVIADIDRDGHAEIVAIANNYAYSGVRGIRVFESANDDWAPTRSIWNQHAYHITNINDDGTVPQFEQPSWLTHNTYRLNTFADRSALSQPDLALFELKYNDSENTLTAILKNRGSAPVNDTVTVSFYTNGDRVDDTPLGELSVETLVGFDEIQLTLANVTPEQLASYVYASIATDADECDTSNNNQGSTVLQVGAYDPLGLFDRQTFLYSTINQNEAPAISSPASSGVASALEYAFTAQVQDPDLGDAHRFSLRDNIPQISINAYSGLIQAQAGTLAPDVYSFTIVVEDSQGLKDEQVHTLTVAVPDNLPPQFEPKTNETIPALQEWSFTALATDPDGDAIQYGLATRPAGMEIDGITGEVFWTPSRDQVGFNVVDIVAQDERGESAHLRFGLEVTDPYADNNPPQIISTPTGAVTVGQQFTYAIEAIVEDGETLSFALEGAAGDMAIDTTTGVFTWLPDVSMVGRTYTVTIVVADSRGGETRQTLALPVNESFNNPPLIVSEPEQSATVGVPYQYSVVATDSDGDTVTISLGEKPNGMNISPTGVVSWTPAQEQTAQVFNVDVIATDARGASSVQTFGIAVNMPVEPNEIPYFTSVPTSPAIIGEQYQYQALAEDPDNDPLVYSLVSPQAAGIELSSNGLFAWTPVAGDQGEYTVAIKVSDGKSSVTQSYSLAVEVAPQDTGAGVNNYPEITSQPLTEIVAGGEYSYQVEASDPDGDTLSYLLLSSSASSASLSPEGMLVWTTSAAETGLQDFRVQVSDGQLSVVQTWTVKVWDEYPPLRLFLGVTPATASVGDEVTLSLATTGGSSESSLALYIDGLPIELDAFGQASIVASEYGLHDVVATASAGEEYQEEAGSYLVLNPSDTSGPIASIATPEQAAIVTAPTSIVGTVKDDNLVSYELYVSPKDQANWQLMASGNSEVENAELGVFDPTMLLNGTYAVVLLATDVNGQTAQDSTTVIVDGDMKVGHYSITFEDVSVDLAGIPVRVTRTYDTRRKSEKLDFGYGWSVDYQNVRIQESRTLGFSWQLNYYRNGFFGDYCVEPNGNPIVTITLPDGSIEKFKTVASPDCSYLVPTIDVQVSFEPLAGTYSSLEQTDYGLLRLANGNIIDMGDIDTQQYGVDPDAYKLTTKDGMVYYLDQSFGIRRVEEPGGQYVTYSDSGIVHSLGYAIDFERDSQNRIVALVLPDGRRIDYSYTLEGDLAQLADFSGDVTEFEYLSRIPHYLDEIIDPNGVSATRMEYDDDGRLTAIIDAEGNRIEYDHNIEGRTSIVADARGNQTIYIYDDNGRVLSETNELGETTTRTYNHVGDVLSETNDLGETRSWTYDERGNTLTETDALGNVTSYTYTEQELEESATNALGIVEYQNTYDTRSRKLTSLTDAMGNVTKLHWDIGVGGNESCSTGASKGFTDALNNVQKNHIACFGPLAGTQTGMTDANGVHTSYGLDSSGRRVSETTTRTDLQGNVISLVTRYEYDAEDRVIRTVHPDGTESTTEYNAVDQVLAEVNALGQRTEYEYDVRGKQILVRYADGSEESKAYDAAGNLTEQTDREGNVTLFEYDAANRQIKVTQPDGASSHSEYNAAGRMVASIDALGNRTEYEYDAAGRRTLVRDALGNETRYEYDAAGRMTAMIDALDRRVEYSYNKLDQRIATTYADGTDSGSEYDALSRRTAEIDQADVATQFEFDNMGRLLKVIDALNQETLYGYDEQGNKVSQTDAMGRTTYWEYDTQGRVSKRILPMGQEESFVYDELGRVITSTDFNGDLTTYQYNNIGQTIAIYYADLSEEHFTYNVLGQRSSATQIASDGSSRTSSYAYDSTGRLTLETQPDGSTLAYEYDLNGNKTSLVVTPVGASAISTAYSYDELNRLQTVSSAEGITSYAYDAVGNRSSISYPNGSSQVYRYNPLNRLTSIETYDGSGALVEQYDYTLHVTGRRTAIAELDGRETNYTYDQLYRLTAENITDINAGDYSASYVYDKVGNHSSETVNGVLTAYSYDANDRITQQGANTFTYDANGNTLSATAEGVTTYYTYNSKNKLVEAETAEGLLSFSYNIAGIRTSKAVDGAATNFVVDSNQAYAQVVVESDGSKAVVYTYGDDLLSQTRDSEVFFYLYDGLGSTRLLSDTAGNVTDSYDYKAFGELLNQSGSAENSYLFTGEQFDASLDQYYLRARYYDQGIGRFTQMDTWGGNNFDPVTLHKYLYANASPANYVDPTGNFSLGSVMSAVNITATLATVGITSYRATGSALEGDFYGAGKEVAIGAISLAVVLKGPQMFKALFGSCARWCTLFYRFSQAERAVIAEAKAFQAAGAYEKARLAVAAGTQVEIVVGTKTVIVAPQLAASGMTFGDDVFLLGREAIVSEAEFAKTLLHELYRLQFQRGIQAGAVGASAEPTAAAFNFAEEAVKLF
ncbi:RHS repeat-associated core domain-containing protein [Alteromonadaceae bacterium Bs31]|nr:RHS repeat-associated core domain-containing protein [Alteromonadaceae bacterium Bs31]